MSAPTIAIPRGGSRAQQEAVQEKEARKNKSGSWGNWEYLRLAPPADGEVYGETIVVRIVDEEPDWREVKQHSWLKTKDAPKDKPSDKGWPKTMGAVCQKSKGFEEFFGGHCYACDEMKVPQKKNPDKLTAPYAGTRLWTVAVVRDEVIGTQEMADEKLIEQFEVGAPVGYVDATVEKDVFEDGKVTGTKTIKKYVVLNFALENFFDQLLGYNDTYKTIVDRDYKITRKGSGTDTKYSIVALDQVPTGETNERGKPVFLDLRRPETKAEYDYSELFNLDQIILEQASDEHYNWYFNKDVESSWEERFGKKDKDSSSNTPAASVPAAAEAKAQGENNSNTLEAMRARMNAARSGKSA